MLYIMELATNIVMPYDTLSEFFDGLTDEQMNTAQKGVLISYGSNDTHCFVEEQVYTEGDDIPSAGAT
jgi:hypothetical protein